MCRGRDGNRLCPISQELLIYLWERVRSFSVLSTLALAVPVYPTVSRQYVNHDVYAPTSRIAWLDW